MTTSINIKWRSICHAHMSVGRYINIPDILECLICSRAVKAPKVRACIHTFCFQCLNAYCVANNTSESGFACTVCRKTLSISAIAIEDVSDHVINQQRRSAESQPFDKYPVCELCLNFENKIESTSYCIDCEQQICDHCRVTHKNGKISRLHRVVRHINISSATKTAKVALSDCDQHPSELVRLYCNDCKKVMCTMCVSEHGQHEVMDVEKSAKKLREQFKTSIKRVLAYAIQKRKDIIMLENEKRIFVEDMAEAESEISKQYDQLKICAQRLPAQLHYCQLFDQLKQFQEEKRRGMKRIKDEMEEEFIMVDSFIKYCVRIMNKGTACEISRVAHELLARVADLVTIRTKLVYQATNIKSEDLFVMSSAREFLRVLVFEELPATVPDKLHKPKLDLKMFLSKHKSTRIIELGYISGLTILANNVYVVRGTSSIDVYNLHNLSEIVHRLSNTVSNNLNRIISCEYHNCLYVSDAKQQVVHRYGLARNFGTKWAVGGKVSALSLSKWFNVLCITTDDNEDQLIKEYDTYGVLIRTIKLDSSIGMMRHCLQLSTENYVVCHAGKEHQICLMNQDGVVLNFYNSPSESAIVNISPVHMCIDAHDNVLVADGNNNRILLLSSLLEYLGDIVVPEYEKLISHSFYLDDLNQRLYIKEYNSERLLAVDFEKHE